MQAWLSDKARRFRILGVALLVGLSPAIEARSHLGAAEPAAGEFKTVRLLTVGNSFSRDATMFLDGIVEAAGHELVHHQAAIGGGTLEQHWEKVRRIEKDPDDPLGLYSSKRSLEQELEEPWDFVTIQQASIRSHDPATYHPFARNLHDFIKSHAPEAEVLVHETWAYRSDDPRFSPEEPRPGEPTTQEEMYQGLARAYQAIAEELDARIIPVGDAFHRVDTDPSWGYRPDRAFDFKAAKRPALPDQTHSLHKGWFWAKQGDTFKLKLDGHHASVAGQYLGGCVFYEVLYDDSVVGNTFLPKGLDAAFADFLQKAAHEAVASAKTRSADLVPAGEAPSSSPR